MSNINPRTARSRAALLDAAWKLIGERGLNVGMAEIARAVGMTRQSVHLHFKTRAGLLVALVRRTDEREQIHARFARALECVDAAERLDAFLGVWFEFVTVIHPVAIQLIAARHGDPEAAEAWGDRMNELRDGFRRLTRSLRRDGALASQWTAPQAADYLWATASVGNWELLAIDCDWGAARTAKVLRRTLAIAVLA